MCILVCMSNIVSSTEVHRSTGDVLDRVAAGEELIVARNGVPIARLIPMSRPADRLTGAGAGRTRQLHDVIAPVIDEM